MGLLVNASKSIQASKDLETQRRAAQAVLDIVENFLARCEAGETIEQPKYAAGENVRAVWKVRNLAALRSIPYVNNAQVDLANCVGVIRI